MADLPHIPGPWAIGSETYFHGERVGGGPPPLKSGRTLPLLPIYHEYDDGHRREVALVWYSNRDQGPAAETDRGTARIVAAAPTMYEIVRALAAADNADDVARQMLAAQRLIGALHGEQPREGGSDAGHD